MPFPGVAADYSKAVVRLLKVHGLLLCGALCLSSFSHNSSFHPS